MSYFNNRKGEVKELQDLLLQPKLESKLHALRQVCNKLPLSPLTHNEDYRGNDRR